jgi:hypothetical protein
MMIRVFVKGLISSDFIGNWNFFIEKLNEELVNIFSIHSKIAGYLFPTKNLAVRNDV